VRRSEHVSKGLRTASSEMWRCRHAVIEKLAVPAVPSTCRIESAKFALPARGIRNYCQPTLQISAQISSFWVLDALCSAAVR
jgi:hypothetical protein